MATVSLAAYSLSVNKLSSTEETFPLGNVAGQDVYELLQEYLKQHKLARKKEISKHFIRAKIFRTRPRALAGTLQTGEYGYTSEIFDGVKLKKAYDRKATDAEMLPFYFLFDLPKPEHKGILLLQRFKIYGIRKIFADDFASFVKARIPNVAISVEPLVHPGLFEKFKAEGNATKIRFRQHQIPQDICDRVRGMRAKDGYIEYTIVAKKNKTLNSFKQFLSGDQKTLLSIPAFNPDTVLYEMKLNGRTRTLDVSNPSHLRSYFDVTERVEIGANGHPTFESVHREACILLRDLWSELKGAADA